MSERLDGREMLAIRARTARAGDGQHQSLAQTETDREALLREVYRLDGERRALKAECDRLNVEADGNLTVHLADRAERDALKVKIGHYEAYEVDVNRILNAKNEALGEAEATIERVRALDDPYPCGSIFAIPHGNGGWRAVLPVADLRAALVTPTEETGDTDD
jgi:hypothetical protein